MPRERQANPTQPAEAPLIETETVSRQSQPPLTFEEKGGEALVGMHELYPSKEALDTAIASGSTSGFSETFEQLEELLVAPSAHEGQLAGSGAMGFDIAPDLVWGAKAFLHSQVLSPIAC